MKEFQSFEKTSPMALKRKRTRKPKPKVTDKEAVIQELAEQLINVYSPRITFFRIPDLLYQAIYQTDRVDISIKKWISDYIKGFPDLVLFNSELGIYLAIEIKTELGRLSHNQKTWQSNLATRVCVGWEATKEAILEFVNKEK